MRLNKSFKNIVVGITVISPLFLFMGQVFAEERGLTAFYDWAKEYYGYAIAFGVGIGMLVLVYGGYLILFSGGNASKASEGKKFIYGALFGIFVLVGSFSFINFINPGILEKGTEIEEIEMVEKDLSGLYLEESGTGKELFLRNSAPSLAAYGSSQQVESYKIVNQNGKEKFGVIFFSDADYRGECYYGGTDATGGGSLPFKPGSVYIFKTTGGSGPVVTVYNNDNGECTNLDEKGESFFPEIMEISDYTAEQKLEDDKRWIDVSAIKIDSKETLVLLKTRNKDDCGNEQLEEGEIPECYHCQLITKTADNENCYPIKYDYVYNPDSIKTMKPGYIKLFQKIAD